MNRHTPVVLCALAFCALLAPSASRAATIFEFVGNCENWGGSYATEPHRACGMPGDTNGSAALGVGGLVTGFISLSEELVSPGTTISLARDDPRWDFYLDSGFFDVSKMNLSTDIVEVLIDSEGSVVLPTWLHWNTTDDGGWYGMFGGYLGSDSTAYFDANGQWLARGVFQQVAAVPEPGSWWLLGSGLLIIGWLARTRLSGLSTD